jgi:hypothetical protein
MVWLQRSKCFLCAASFAHLVSNAEVADIDGANPAISDRDDSLEFVAGGVSHDFTTVDNGSEYSLAEQGVAAPCKRLDQLNLSGDSIILKIDVESQE